MPHRISTQQRIDEVLARTVRRLILTVMGAAAFVITCCLGTLPA